MPASFDLSAAEVVLEPEAPGAGFWVGAPTVLRDGPRVLMSYRRRRPRGASSDRGYAAYIAESADGLRFHEVAVLRKEALQSTSIERTALVPLAGGGWAWLVSFVDPADGRWRVDAFHAGRLADLPRGERRTVFTAAAIGAEGVKDPVVLRADGRWWMLLSCAGAPGGEAAERLHGTHDVYHTGLAACFNGLAISADGVRWEWAGPCRWSGGAWDAYQARLGAVLPAGPLWVGLYDGSASVGENYEERLGVAWSSDLHEWRSLTTDGPAVTAPGSGSLRYASLLTGPDGIDLYAECARADGSHDLRRARLNWLPADPSRGASP